MKRLGFLVGIVALLTAAILVALPVSAATFSTFSTTSTTVQGGKTISTTVRLASAAPSGGQVVTFSTSNSYATAPAPMTIAAGKTYVTARFTTRGVDHDIRVTLTAESGGVEKTLSITLTPPQLSSLSTPTSMTFGSSGSGTVRLGTTALAPTEIDLSSSAPGTVAVPSTVTVLAGKSSVTFVVTGGVNAGTATITASFAGLTKTDTTKVVAPAIYSVSAPSSIIAGTSVTGTVTLTGITLADVVVNLSSSNPGNASVPASVTVPAGSKSAPYSIGTTSSSLGSVTISASLNGVTKTKTTTVKIATLYSIGITRTLAGEDSTTGKARLTGPAPVGGITVTLSIPAGSPLTIPAKVTVPEGADYQNFPVTAGSPTSSTSVTVTGTANGVTKTAKVTVTPPVVLIDELMVYPVPVGSNSFVCVEARLSGPAPLSGLSVSFSSSIPLKLPINGIFTVPPGLAVAIDCDIVGVVSVDTPVVVTVKLGADTKSVNVVLKPYIVAEIEMPAEMAENNSASGTVYLSGLAASLNTSVTLESSDPGILSVPASVTVAQGQGFAGFSLTSYEVDAPTVVTITASANGESVANEITVSPLRVVSVVSAFDQTGITVILNGEAQEGGFAVDLTNSNPSATTLPATATIPADRDRVFIQVTNLTPANAVITVTASGGGSTASVLATIAPSTLKAIEYPISPYIQSGSTLTAKVKLNGPAPAGGLVVNLASANPGAASVPATVTVAAGATTADFLITAPARHTGIAVPLAATAGTKTIASTINVLRLSVSNLNLSSNSVEGGSSVELTVKLSGTVDSGIGPVAVNLASLDPSVVTVPGSVVVPIGSNSVTVTILTNPVASPVSVTVISTLNNATDEVQLSVTPAPSVPTPTETVIPTSTATLEPTSTATPENTPTDLPTVTDTPTDEPTATETPTPE